MKKRKHRLRPIKPSVRLQRIRDGLHPDGIIGEELDRLGLPKPTTVKAKAPRPKPKHGPVILISPTSEEGRAIMAALEG